MKQKCPQPKPKTTVVMESQESRLPSLFILPLIQFFVGIFLFIALLHSQRDLALLAILLLSLMFIAALWSRISLIGIKCYMTVNKAKVFPGESLTLNIRLENAKFLPVWLQVKMPVDSPLSLTSYDTSFINQTGLLWYQRAYFDHELIAQKRGVYQVGPPVLNAADPFGFFPREGGRTENLQVIVYPRIVPLRPILLPRRDFFGSPGAKSPVQDPIYILGTRDYQHWSPARYIHWKASARHNCLQQKVFEPSEQLKALLVIDVDKFAENNASEDFEHTLEAVASLAVQFDRMGYATGLATNAVVEGGPATLPLCKNPQQLPAILEVLARLKMKPKRNLADIWNRGLNVIWGATCIHFSYGEDKGLYISERFFKQRKIPMIFVVCHAYGLSEDNMYKVRSKIYLLDEIRTKQTERE